MIGIGATSPAKKLDIKGYGKIDTIIIRLIYWYFNKKNISVTFFHKPEMNDSPYLLSGDELKRTENARKQLNKQNDD